MAWPRGSTRGIRSRETDTFNDKQSQIAERKTGDFNRGGIRGCQGAARRRGGCMRAARTRQRVWILHPARPDPAPPPPPPPPPRTKWTRLVHPAVLTGHVSTRAPLAPHTRTATHGPNLRAGGSAPPNRTATRPAPPLLTPRLLETPHSHAQRRRGSRRALSLLSSFLRRAARGAGQSPSPAQSTHA